MFPQRHFSNRQRFSCWVSGFLNLQCAPFSEIMQLSFKTNPFLWVLWLDLRLCIFDVFFKIHFAITKAYNGSFLCFQSNRWVLKVISFPFKTHIASLFSSFIVVESPSLVNLSKQSLTTDSFDRFIVGIFEIFWEGSDYRVAKINSLHFKCIIAKGIYHPSIIDSSDLIVCCRHVALIDPILFHDL